MRKGSLPIKEYRETSALPLPLSNKNECFEKPVKRAYNSNGSSIGRGRDWIRGPGLRDLRNCSDELRVVEKFTVLGPNFKGDVSK